jgi:hypothetical protein
VGRIDQEKISLRILSKVSLRDVLEIDKGDGLFVERPQKAFGSAAMAGCKADLPRFSYKTVAFPVGLGKNAVSL